jgi:hypothetical protein
MTEVVELAREEWLVIETPAPAQTLEVSMPALEVLEVAAQGPAGPPGPPGAQGAPGLAGANYVHTQSLPTASWTIAHGLGRFPSVTVVDSAGTTVYGEVEYLSPDSVALHFSAGFAGQAFLN